MYTVTLNGKKGNALVTYTYPTEELANACGFDWFLAVGVVGPIESMSLYHVGTPEPLRVHTFIA